MTPSTWRSRWPSTIIYGFMEARHEAGPDTKHVRRERQVAVCGRRAARDNRGIMALGIIDLGAELSGPRCRDL